MRDSEPRHPAYKAGRSPAIRLGLANGLVDYFDHPDFAFGKTSSSSPSKEIDPSACSSLLRVSSEGTNRTV